MAKDDGFEGVDASTSSHVDEAAEEAKAMAAIDALDDSGSGKEPPVTTTASEGKKDDTPAGTPSGAKEDDGAVVEPSGVLAADGKNIIPYDVLKSTRENQARAEEAAREATALAEQLRAENEALKQGKTETTTETVDAVADRIKALREQADSIREELPAMAGMLDGMIEVSEQALSDAAAVRKSLEERDATDKAQRERTELAVAKTAEEKVREAIDSNPTLAFWETHQDMTAFNTAADIDQALRVNPKWQDKPIAERLSKVVELTIATLPDAPVPSKTLSAAEIAARAKKAVDDAGEVDLHSLSDLPAGAPPGSDPLENLANVDTVTLGNRVGQMSDAQIEGLLARLG